MPRRRTRLIRARASTSADDGLLARFTAIRAKLDVPAEFPPEVVAEAEQAAPEAEQSAPEGAARTDLTALPFVTVDPPGATDLDQAMHLERAAPGYRVHYAIADVPAFVRPGGAVDTEARRRGQTIYAPDQRTPLHPPALSEHAASLLPDQRRAAFVWRFDLDAQGEVTAVDLDRAWITSRRQLDYAQVQAAADGTGTPEPDLAGLAELLREIGERRQALEIARGGASLALPEQEVVRTGERFELSLRAPLPSEDWNAQLSLMTGMAAAELMLKAGAGILRTMPEPEPGALQHFRDQVQQAGLSWPAGQTYGAFLRTLDPARPEHLALLYAAAALFRGAGYTPFDGPPPAQTGHAAVAVTYAHVTAPLRRLVDRFGLLCAWSAHRGEPVPDWVRAALPALPEVMAASDRLAGEVERQCLDAVEVAVLSGRDPGSVFDAIVVGTDKNGEGGKVQLVEPPVLARCTGRLTAGTRIKVRLDPIAPDAAAVQFSLV